MIILRRRTGLLLADMKSLRERRVSHRGDDGRMRFTRHRGRSAKDYLRILQFKRCPAWAREECEMIMNNLLRRARRYED